MQFQAIYDPNGKLADIVAEIGSRRIPMAGPVGSGRELQFVKPFLAQKNQLPVFLGAGLGAALEFLLANYAGPLAILDRHENLRQLTGLPQSLPAVDLARITLITDDNPAEALSALRQWQEANGNLPLGPIPLSFYQRIDPDWYGALRKELTRPFATSPQGAKKPRILLLTHKYFLMGEIAGACQKLGYDHKLIVIGQKEADSEQFVNAILAEAANFKPDFCLTLNHTGIDMEGVLMRLLDKLQLPLASWFVDNPDLIIHLYAHNVSPWITIFTWDEDNLPSLQKSGFAHSFYLPLGTDPERFKPHAGKPDPAWRAPVSFVGNSMVYKVQGRLKSGRFPQSLLKNFTAISRQFAQSDDRSVAHFLSEHAKKEYEIFQALPTRDARLAYETAITWKATEIYRNERVMELLPFHPLIVGDDGWKIIFRHARPKPRLLPPINYYEQLPIFYGESEINFNSTSRQMKGAVNQRVFDVPAVGGFVLTDWRPQMEGLFKPDEMICYHGKEEIPELVRYYLDHPGERHKIATRARERVLACHTWAHRLKALAEKMQEIYG